MKITKLLAALALLGSLGSAHAAPFSLNLEGIVPWPSLDSALVGDFYNGGVSSAGTSGVDYGVAFVGEIQTTCLNSGTVFCSSTSKGGAGVAGSEQTAMTLGFGGGWLNVAAGFDTAFAFAFAQPLAFTDTTVNVYSGLDGTGELLGSLLLPITSDPDFACEPYQAGYCPFYNAAIAFDGVARSVTFEGFGGLAAYDDLTFGSTVVGAGAGPNPDPDPDPVGVPEPSSLMLLAAALGMLGLRRRQG